MDKPMTGEWTPERVSKLINDPALNGIALNKITDAFNAALKAEREKVKTLVELLCESVGGITGEWKKKRDAALAEVKK